MTHDEERVFYLEKFETKNAVVFTFQGKRTKLLQNAFTGANFSYSENFVLICIGHDDQMRSGKQGLLFWISSNFTFFPHVFWSFNFLGVIGNTNCFVRWWTLINRRKRGWNSPIWRFRRPRRPNTKSKSFLNEPTTQGNKLIARWY